MDRTYETFEGAGRGHVKAWVDGVQVDEQARDQLRRVAALPFVHGWVAAMPDVHVGKGATIGSVIPTVGAIIPAAVGVDIGCGMVAVRTSLEAEQLPDSLAALRSAIEAAVPHGRSGNGGKGDQGAWRRLPKGVEAAWTALSPRFDALVAKHPKIADSNHITHLGTLGTGNHFVELCLDEQKRVWVMLHSGSRGVGNKIGSLFIERAQRETEKRGVVLDDRNLSWLPEGTDVFDDYVAAVGWAQDFAKTNRRLMLEATLRAMTRTLGEFTVDEKVVDCHHNYVTREHHFGKDVWLTRKGAVRARKGDLGIIPGSMGTRSFIVCGRGCDEAFHSCSHGAGRAMSRTEAKRRFTVDDHVRATAGIECRKDENVIDETPAAYKPIDQVMEAQRELVDVVHELRQVLCVKG